MDNDQYRIALPNGQPSEAFNTANLQAYAAAGHIQPTTWIFVQGQGRWIAASEIPALQPLWASRGVTPQYGAPYVQQVRPNNNSAIGKWALGLVIFMAVALFVVLLPIFIRGPHRAASSAPVALIAMKSYDGFYSVKIPDNWIPGHNSNPDVPVFFDADTSRTVSIRKMTTYPCSSQQVHTLCAARTAFDFANKNWVAIGNAVPVTVAGYHGWRQTLNGQNRGNTEIIQLNFISTPKGVYDVAEVHFTSDPDGQKVLDDVVNSFHTEQPQLPPKTF